MSRKFEEPEAAKLRYTETSLIDEHNAALCLGLSVKTLRRWRWARRGPIWIKIGTAVRYAPADLAAFIAAGRQSPRNDI
jgi:hypothetical protein